MEENGHYKITRHFQILINIDRNFGETTHACFLVLDIDVNGSADYSDMTALNLAVIQGNMSLVKVLIAHPDIDIHKKSDGKKMHVTRILLSTQICFFVIIYSVVEPQYALFEISSCREGQH